jgi:hypothetical protein
MRWIDHHAVHLSFFIKISPLAHQAMKSIHAFAQQVIKSFARMISKQ